LKRTNRIISFLLAVTLLVCVLPVNAFAASYDDCDSPMFGWGISLSKKYDQKVGSKKGIGGLDNRRSSLPADYSFTSSFTHSISCTSALATELNGSINFDKGDVKGGLGAKINSSFSITNSFTRTYSESYKTTVPAKRNLTLYSQAYGVKLTVYAIYHVAWIHGTKVTGSLSIPQYQKYVPSITK
jgi:hypothetical protein